MPGSDRSFTAFARAASLVAALSPCACSTLPPGQSAVDSFTIKGTRDVDSADLADKLATQATPKFLGLFRGVVYDYVFFNRATLQRDLARVERYYRERGYYAAHARAGRVITSAPGHVRVEILVEEGPPTRNRGLTIEGIGDLDPAVQREVEHAARASLPEGRPFDAEKARECEDAVRAVLTDHGYAFAAVKRDSYIDVVNEVADTTLTVTRGAPARFGPIRIEGLDPDGVGPRRQEIPEAPVRRAIDITEGQAYSTRRVDAATKALLDLEIFASVSVTPDLSHPESQVVPIDVHVEPTSLRQIRLGGGFEFDEIKAEAHLLAGWENHNFLGGLRDLEIDFTPGVVFYPTRIDNLVAPNALFLEEKLRVQLRQPGFLEPATQAFIRPEFNVFPLLVQVDPLPTDPVIGYREFKGAVGVDRTFFKRFYVNLSYDAQIENPFSYAGTLDPALSTLVVAYPELITKLDLRDNPDRPHAGVFLANDLQIAGGIFGGDARDLRIQPEIRTYIPLGRRVTFATRGTIGLLLERNYGDVTSFVVRGQKPDTTAPLGSPTNPTPQQIDRDMETVLFRGFFSGGPSSNRGYPLRGVSPHGIVPFLNPTTASAQAALKCLPNQNPDPTICSIPIGGFNLWELSNELRFTVQGPVSGAVFCDMGDAGLGFHFDWLHLSCGVGARYDTPVGPIRLDVGYRIQPLQILGEPNEAAAFAAHPEAGLPPTLLGFPIAIAVGIGEAY